MNSHEAVARFNMIAPILGRAPLKISFPYGYDDAIAELKTMVQLLEAHYKIIIDQEKKLKTAVLLGKVKDILKEKHWNKSKLSRKLELSHPLITLWVNGARNIGVKYGPAIEKIWGTRGIE